MKQKCADWWFELIFGGDEESRTPVHKPFHINFSECSLLFKFLYIRLTNKTNYKVVSKLPFSFETIAKFVSLLVWHLFIVVGIL